MTVSADAFAGLRFGASQRSDLWHGLMTRCAKGCESG
jgi:hypothetical protein